MNIDTLLFGETVQDQKGNVRRDFSLCNMVVWGLIIALIYTYSGGKGGKRQKGGRTEMVEQGLRAQIFMALVIAMFLICVVVFASIIVMGKKPQNLIGPS